MKGIEMVLRPISPTSTKKTSLAESIIAALIFATITEALHLVYGQERAAWIQSALN
jgi:hypothetical protein